MKISFFWDITSAQKFDDFFEFNYFHILISYRKVNFMDNEDIVNYVMDSPENTNPAVLRGMLG